jgi:hypothetical protein
MACGAEKRIIGESVSFSYEVHVLYNQESEENELDLTILT